MTEYVVVVGAGPSGARCAELLAAKGGGRMRVTLIGEEPGAPYNRVALSQLLAGDIDEAALITHSFERLRELAVTHRPGSRVCTIDRAAGALHLQDGAVLQYDRLVLATGAQPFRPPLPGADGPGVLMYRTLEDVRRMLRSATRGGPAVVIGGGLLGLEAAAGLARRGMQVTVVHALDRVMNRQLDAMAASLLARRLAGLGIGLELSAQTAAIVPDGVVLSDGRCIPAALVVMAIGIRPEIALARAAGLAMRQGILVDDSMRSSDPAIHAVGECAEHGGQCCGLVAPALAQAETAARAILGEPARYVAPTDAAALKVAGAKVWSAGDIFAAGDAITYDDPDAGLYRKLVLQDDRLVGAMLYGETADAPFYLELIRQGRDLSGLRDCLAFGPAFLPVEVH